MRSTLVLHAGYHADKLFIPGDLISLFESAKKYSISSIDAREEENLEYRPTRNLLISKVFVVIKKEIHSLCPINFTNWRWENEERRGRRSIRFVTASLAFKQGN